MLFKEELPPPRHTLDAGDFSDSDANVVTTHEMALELAPRAAAAPPQRLLLLALKCAALAAELGAEPCGRIRVTTVRRSTALGAATADAFYEFDAADAADFTTQSSWTLPVLARGDLLVVVGAALPEAEAAFAGKQLVARLRPAQLVAATPGLSFMREPVSCLATPGAAVPAGVPLAAPPVLVQGVCAAALSRARQLDVPALALVVGADGPANHEIVDEDRLAALRAALGGVLGRALARAAAPSSRVDTDVSTLYV